jgi:hypothetical protein
MANKIPVLGQQTGASGAGLHLTGSVADGGR